MSVAPLRCSFQTPSVTTKCSTDGLLHVKVLQYAINSRITPDMLLPSTVSKVIFFIFNLNLSVSKICNVSFKEWG